MSRRLFVIVVAAALSLGAAGAARADDRGAAGATDPALEALRAAVAEFRADLAALRDTCGALKRSARGASGERASECESRYAELRAEYKELRRLAIELGQRLKEWTQRAKDEAERFAKEAEKEAAQRREQERLRGRSLEEKLRWLVNHMLQDKVDLAIFERRAGEAREQAEQLVGEQREQALAVAAKWERKTAEYAAGLRQHEAERQALLAAIAAGKEKPQLKKEQPQKEKGSASDLDRLLAKLRALDEHMQQDRLEMERFQQKASAERERAASLDGEEKEAALASAERWERKAAEYAKGLLQHEAERAELLRAIEKAKQQASSSQRDQLLGKLSALDEDIAHKRATLTEYKQQLQQELDAAATLTGEAKEEMLAKVRQCEQDVAELTGKLNNLLAQRTALLTKLGALPVLR